MSFAIRDLDGKELRVGTLLGQSPSGVCIGDLELPMEALLDVARYVLQNTDLLPQDPRLGFLKWTKSLRKAAGWNKGGKRLAPPSKDKCRYWNTQGHPTGLVGNLCDSHEGLRARIETVEAVMREVLDSEVNVVLLLAGKPVFRKLGELLGERNSSLFEKAQRVLAERA